MDFGYSDNTSNASSVSLENGIISDISYTNRVIFAAISIIISTVGTVGNTMVIIAVLLSRKLQTPPNVFVVNLAVADLITCFFIVCRTLALFSEDGWPFPGSEWLCAATAYMITICVGVSLLTLATISINRYVLVAKQYKTYQKLFSIFKIGLMVAATWLISMATGAIYIISQGKLEYTKICTDEQDPDNQSRSTLVRIIYILTVLAIIVISYGLVFRHVRQHMKKLRQRQQREVLSLATVSGDHTSKVTSGSHSQHHASSVLVNRRRDNGFNKKDLQVTKNLAILVAAFLICFIPYFTINVSNVNVILQWYCVLLIFANSAINPIIYARRFPNFTEVFKAIIKCQLQKIPEPTEVTKRLTTRIHPMV